MSLVSDVIAALDTTATFAVVGRAADHAIALTTAATLPAAYVVLSAVDADGNSLGGICGNTDQRIWLTLEVMIGVSNLDDERGQAAGADLDDLRDAVRGALHGRAFSNHSQMEFIGGYLMGYDQSVLWWIEQYHAFTRYRTVP